MKITKTQLRKLIEGLFVGSPDGTVYSPKDIQDAERSGKTKDAQSWGKHPGLDRYKKKGEEDIEAKKHSRSLATQMDFQDALTPFEEFVVDDIDPDLIHQDSPLVQPDPFVRNPKFHKIKNEIVKDFKQYIHSPEGVRAAEEIVEEALEGYAPGQFKDRPLALPIWWEVSLIDDENRFHLSRIIQEKYGLEYRSGTEFYGSDEFYSEAITAYQHIMKDLKALAEAKFNAEFIDLVIRKLSKHPEIEGRPYPLTITELRKLINNIIFS